MKVYRNSEINEIPFVQSWLVGTIENITYNGLVNILGYPTYNEPSGDNKTQVEWTIEFEGNLFHIYDWKTYNREFTLNSLETWNIGGNTEPSKLIEYIKRW
jgi:hypothetical protein